jgi:hypothetical protein
MMYLWTSIMFSEIPGHKSGISSKEIELLMQRETHGQVHFMAQVAPEAAQRI